MVENEIMATLGLGDPAGMVGSATSGILNAIFILLVLVVLAGICWFAIWYSSFKISVIIREVTNKRRYVTSDKAKIKKLDGVEMYYLRRRRVYLNIPPPEALEITSKGRYFCECYHNGEAGLNTGYSWIKDDVDDLEETDDTFKPLSSQRQAQLVNRIRRAEARKGKNIWENVVPIVMSVSMIIIIAIPFMFYGELTEANKEAMELTKQITNMQAKMSEELVKGIDILTGKLSRDELVFIQDIPLDQQLPPDVVEAQK